MTEQQLEKGLLAIKKIKKAWFITFNLLYVAAYLAYAIYSLYHGENVYHWMPYVLITIAVIYFISFMFILCIKNEKTVKLLVKNYKMILKALKRGLRLFNLVLSIIMIANTVATDGNVFSFVLTITNIVLICLQSVISIRKFIKTNFHRKRKEQKRLLVKDLIHDILTIVLSFDDEDTENFSDDVFEDNINNNQENISIENSVNSADNIANDNLPDTAVTTQSNENNKQNHVSLRKLTVSLFPEGVKPVKRLKEVAKKGFVNALVNADSIIDRVNQYKEDKQQLLKKKKKKEDNNNNNN